MKEAGQNSLTEIHPYTKIFEALPGIILILSPDLIIQNVSNEFLKATLRERGLLVGKNLFEAFPDNPNTPNADGVKNLSASLQSVLSTKQPHTMPVQRYDIEDPNKKNQFIERYWQTMNIPVLDDEGQVSYIINQSTDVTEAYKGNLELNESRIRERDALAEIEHQKRQLHNLFEQAPVAITILLGSNYIIELANPTICEIWNRTSKEVIGKPLFEALPEVGGQGLEELLKEVFTTGVPFIGKEIPVTMKRVAGPETVYFNFVYKPLLVNNEIVGILVVSTDVTEQVRARQTVESKQKELIKVNQELATANEEIQASNEELNVTNEELFQTQDKLNNLNFGLEKTIEIRTEQLNIARKEAELDRLRLHSIFMQAPVGIIIFEGKNHLITLANPTICKMVGRSMEQLINKPLFEAIPEVKNQGFVEIYTSVFENGKPFELQEIPASLEKDGKLVTGFYHILLQPIVDIENNVTGIIEVATEVTESVVSRNKLEIREKELKALTKKLEKSNNELRSVNEEIRFLLESMPQKVWKANSSGRITYFNKSWEEYVKQSLEELNESGWEKIIHPEDVVANVDIWRRSMAHGIDYEYEQRFRRYDGQYRWHLSRGIPQKDSKGNIILWVGTNTDIHEQKMLQYQLQEKANELIAAHEEIMAGNEELISNNEDLASANQQLLRVNADLDNFIYTASHDLKAPIANIEGLVNALNRSITPQEKTRLEKFIQLIEASIARFKRTVDDLTEVAKLQKEEETSSIDFVEILDEVKLDLHTLIESSNVKFEVTNCNCLFNFSRKNFKSIVYNLISNALKYRSPERSPVIKISCSEENDYKVISIQDNGLGMKLNKDTKIFSMFKRLHNHVEGSGIGLYIVKKIIDNAGGKIEVFSKVNEGTLFKVYLKSKNQG